MREMTGNDANLSGDKYPDVVKEIASETNRAWAENNAQPVEQQLVVKYPVVNVMDVSNIWIGARRI